MLRVTMKQLKGLDISSSVTICIEEHRFFFAEQLREINMLGSVTLELMGRNTAPAIALEALASDDDPLVLMLAAENVIHDELAFTKAVSETLPLAEAGKLVTFGIIPSEPYTGYGYIKKGSETGADFVANELVEKPSSKLAKEYLLSGDYSWNSGMFLFSASRYLDELTKFRPDIFEACRAATV